ncbi:Outer membrane efflux protein [Candidatus Magnetobacterium bavaricum]|uniref:Outer membrane efflux protein n=1 Tax=Candidatus Magnetobacterium bavaricum TaxID=29290 RepID=A0A0F3GI54_9BACT|nr:Outer membrane efflux protein [Candidatus Magnetobacterium bavaricum]
MIVIAGLLAVALPVHAEDTALDALIEEALQNNHEVLMAQSRAYTSKFRTPQASTLPDPMVMFGYQNEGWNRYNYGQMSGAQWMLSVSQMFPYPGKLALKEQLTIKDTEVLDAVVHSVRLKTAARVEELYYDLFLTYKNIALIQDRVALFARIEDAALSRYASGMGQQVDVLMAQTEKYMLIEKQEMERQKMHAIEGMLNSTLGRLDVNTPIARPRDISPTPYVRSMADALMVAFETSPDILSKVKEIEATEVKVSIAQREYYPDINVSASVAKRGGEFEDMWSLTAAVNVPIFYKTKQRMAVSEARSMLSESKHDVDALKTMLASTIRENYTMIQTADKLIELYKNALIPRTYQDFELALSAYVTGKVEAITVISPLKSLIDYETLYFRQLVERQKAIARIEAIAPFGGPATEGGKGGQQK